jgi:hypothetical protein
VDRQLKTANCGTSSHAKVAGRDYDDENRRGLMLEQENADSIEVRHNVGFNRVLVVTKRRAINHPGKSIIRATTG